MTKQDKKLLERMDKHFDKMLALYRQLSNETQNIEYNGVAWIDEGANLHNALRFVRATGEQEQADKGIGAKET